MNGADSRCSSQARPPCPADPPRAPAAHWPARRTAAPCPPRHRHRHRHRAVARSRSAGSRRSSAPSATAHRADHWKCRAHPPPASNRQAAAGWSHAPVTTIPQQQIEGRYASPCPAARDAAVPHPHRRAGSRAPGVRATALGAAQRLAHIGDRGQSSGTRQCHPAAALEQVASAVDLRRIRPLLRRQRGRSKASSRLAATTSGNSAGDCHASAIRHISALHGARRRACDSSRAASAAGHPLRGSRQPRAPAPESCC